VKSRCAKDPKLHETVVRTLLTRHEGVRDGAEDLPSCRALLRAGDAALTRIENGIVTGTLARRTAATALRKYARAQMLALQQEHEATRGRFSILLDREGKTWHACFFTYQFDGRGKTRVDAVRNLLTSLQKVLDAHRDPKFIRSVARVDLTDATRPARRRSAK
jgi:hypothetical protein